MIWYLLTLTKNFETKKIHAKHERKTIFSVIQVSIEPRDLMYSSNM